MATQEDPKRIMVVDDDLLISSLVSRLLRSRGYTAAAVESPGEALELAKQYQPDLIISDLEMPGLDGPDLCVILKGSPLTQSIPVVFLSAHSDQWNQELADFSGAAAFIAKPFRGDELVETVRSVIDLPPPWCAADSPPSPM